MNAAVEGVPVGLVRRKDRRVPAFRNDLCRPLTGRIQHELPVTKRNGVAPAILLIFKGDFDAFPVVFDLLGEVRPQGWAEVRLHLRNRVDSFIDLHHHAVDVVGVLGINLHFPVSQDFA